MWQMQGCSMIDICDTLLGSSRLHEDGGIDVVSFEAVQHVPEAASIGIIPPVLGPSDNLICKAPLRNYQHIYIYIYIKLNITKDTSTSDNDRSLFASNFRNCQWESQSWKFFPCPSCLFHPASIPQDEMKSETKCM